MAVEFRGCKRLVYAPVTQDDEEAYTTGEVKTLAPVAMISKSTEVATTVKSYDDKSAISIRSEGADTVTLTIAVPDDETLADITGRSYDKESGRFIESEIKTRYFAIGYILGEVGEGDDERYVWRYKGTFGIPDETSNTKDQSTDSNNMSLTYTGVYTEHIFDNGMGPGKNGSAKSSYIRASSKKATADQWFVKVSDPDDTLSA